MSRRLHSAKNCSPTSPRWAIALSALLAIPLATCTDAPFPLSGPTDVEIPARDSALGAAGALPVSECDQMKPEWLWCDDFESNRLSGYFGYSDGGGRFVRQAGVGVSGGYGMRVRFDEGTVSAGTLQLSIGRNPAAGVGSNTHGDPNARYRDVYWRMYVRTEPGWIGSSGHKLNRATVLAGSNWQQAMIAHVWGDDRPELVADPASGTDESGNLMTTRYNDFANLRWLGSRRGATPVFSSSRAGEWQCVEARARLNDAGQSNGVFQMWINGELDAQRTDLNWVGSYDSYGINAVFFENYWNGGAPQRQERFFDNLVVSTARIGCLEPGSGDDDGNGGDDDGNDDDGDGDDGDGDDDDAGDEDVKRRGWEREGFRGKKR
jgi:hypothetical protein